MSNLTANEYFKDFYNTPNDYNKLIRVVRIDSADSYYRKKGVYFTPFTGQPGDSKYTAIVLVAIFRTEKKSFTIGHYIINNYEDDNETIKKKDTHYLIWDDIITDENFNKKELDAFELDSAKQLDRINKYIQYSVNDYSGTWSIIQDPWDPNVVADFIPNNPRDTTHDVEKTTPPPEKTIEPAVIPPVVIPPPIKLQCDFNFSVKKENTFVITSGNNGNLVSLPDGTIVDLGELSVIKKEDPNDPEIIRILTPYSDELLELDSEYTDENFAGAEEDLVFVDAVSGEISQESSNNIKGYDPENPDDSLSTDNGSKYPISKDQDKNIKAVIKIAKDSGITNGYSIAAMLAICKKESGLVPKGEASYSGTGSSRIKSIFSKFKKYTDSEVDKIKKDAKKFFDIIYGGKYDNGADEGYKYRGRGFNQITFKGNYKKYKRLSGYDIISDPDLLNTVDVAAKCLVEYFKSNFSDASKNIKSKYNFTDINSFKSLKDATGAFYHANAGFGKSYSEIVADSTGGRAKAFSYVDKLYNDYLGPDRKK